MIGIRVDALAMPKLIRPQVSNQPPLQSAHTLKKKAFDVSRAALNLRQKTISKNIFRELFQAARHCLRASKQNNNRTGPSWQALRLRSVQNKNAVLANRREIVRAKCGKYVIRVDTSSYFASGFGVDNITDNGDGTWTYNNWVDDPTPIPASPRLFRRHRRDSFSYDIIDSAGNITSGYVGIYVSDPGYDDPPIARPDYATTMEDTPVTFNVLGNDWDDLGFTIHGSFHKRSRRNGVLGQPGECDLYARPRFPRDRQCHLLHRGFSPKRCLGHFKYRSHARQRPAARRPQSAWTGWEQTIQINVLDEATDVEMDAGEPGNELIVTDANGALRGKTSIMMEPHVYYTPNPDFTTGYDTFTYIVDDGHGGLGHGKRGRDDGASHRLVGTIQGQRRQLERQSARRGGVVPRRTPLETDLWADAPEWAGAELLDRARLGRF